MTVWPVAFDFGRVLVHQDPDVLYRCLISDEEARRRFLGYICDYPWIVEQDRSRIRALWASWREMVPGAYSKTVAIFCRLIADVTLLTKRAAVSFDEAARNFAFLG